LPGDGELATWRFAWQQSYAATALKRHKPEAMVPVPTKCAACQARSREQLAHDIQHRVGDCRNGRPAEESEFRPNIVATIENTREVKSRFWHAALFWTCIGLAFRLRRARRTAALG